MPSSAPIVNILNWFLWLGSAFVQFIDPASVQHCLQTSGESLLFNGRMLDVTLALSPRELSAIKECGEEKSDKRNLYLSKEGSKQTHTHTHTHSLSLPPSLILPTRCPIWIRSSSRSIKNRACKTPQSM